MTLSTWTASPQPAVLSGPCAQLVTGHGARGNLPPLPGSEAWGRWACECVCEEGPPLLLSPVHASTLPGSVP